MRLTILYYQKKRKNYMHNNIYNSMYNNYNNITIKITTGKTKFEASVINRCTPSKIEIK